MVGKAASDCPVIPRLLGEVGRCDLASCGKPLPPRRRRWCSNECSRHFQRVVYENHDWNAARAAALKRDKLRCVRCDSDGTECIVGERYTGLEVNHIEPRRGKGYGMGCHHHLSNLETLCRRCHVATTNAQRAALRGTPSQAAEKP